MGKVIALTYIINLKKNDYGFVYWYNFYYLRTIYNEKLIFRTKTRRRMKRLDLFLTLLIGLTMITSVLYYIEKSYLFVAGLFKRIK